MDVASGRGAANYFLAISSPNGKSSGLTDYDPPPKKKLLEKTKSVSR